MPKCKRDLWNQGYSDGWMGRPPGSLWINDTYRDGYEAGEATASGDTEPLTDEERREIYGIESRSQEES